MDMATARVGIAAGGGLVGRFGETVVLVARAEDAGSAELFDLVEALAAGGEPGSALAGRLAAWVVGRPPGDAIAFGMASPVADGVMVFLRGPVWAEVGVSGAGRLSGQDALTWVDRIVPGPVERVTVGCSPDAAAAAHPRSDLRSGVVPGGGFVVLPAHAPVPARPTPAAPAASPKPARATPAQGSAGAAAVAARTGGAVETRVPSGNTSTVRSVAPAGRPGVESDAPASGLGGANRAAAPSPVPATKALRVALGRLTSQTAPTIVLDRAYVLGREPQNDPVVRRGAATPIVVHDADNLISRVHVYLSVEGKVVMVQDAGSVSGTYVAPPGAQDWSTVTGGPTRLAPGWSLRMGRHVFVFEPGSGDDG